MGPVVFISKVGISRIFFKSFCINNSCDFPQQERDRGASQFSAKTEEVGWGVFVFAYGNLFLLLSFEVFLFRSFSKSGD